MTGEELRERWLIRRGEFNRLAVHVDGVKVIDEFLNDLASVVEGEEGTLLKLSDASRLSGYSIGHLARLLRSGIIPNAGRVNAPLIRRRDLKMKANYCLFNGATDAILPTKVQIAQSVVHPKRINDG